VGSISASRELCDHLRGAVYRTCDLAESVVNVLGEGALVPVKGKGHAIPLCVIWMGEVSPQQRSRSISDDVSAFLFTKYRY
jgi:hypothetical protein